MAKFRTLKELADEARAVVQEVEPHEVNSDGFEPIIIDVREPEEWSRGTIPGAHLIPRGILERDIAKTVFDGDVDDKALTRRIVCYCGGGPRALLAARNLRAMGFTRACALSGGFARWRALGREMTSV